MIKLFITAFLLVLPSQMFLYFHKKEKTLTCKAEFSVIKNTERLDIVSLFSLKSGKGVFTLSGVLYDDNQIAGHISRNIGFTYKKRGGDYALRSSVVVNSPLMELSPHDEDKWLPAFFSRENKTILFKIRPLSENQWLIYSGVVPQYLCEKVL
ncbi:MULTISPECIES: hypothetical protein [Serratia]|uniref:hypothetical protein n=1 Tax=Serratia TaxID=613 RepID=UPI0013DBCA44|nr:MULTISPECIES: hypothetical protein [Serratia]MBH2655766.1 hypothetical protein [Serratia ureilytica]MBJ2092272.1 hypothetical protein [Serratia ureilytica]